MGSTSVGSRVAHHSRKSHELIQKQMSVQKGQPSAQEQLLRLTRFVTLKINIKIKINIKTKTEMLNSLVRSRMLYSCQTWCCTKTQLTHINAIYISFLRRMIKGGYRRKDDSWAFVLKNSDLLRIAKTEDVHSFVNRQRSNFVAKINQKENTSILKRLLYNDDDAKKRPKASLLSMINRL